MTDIKDAYSLITSLKNTRRKGWLNRGLNSDSIAEHTYGVIVVGWYMANKEGVDVNRVIEMLLVHDLVMAKMEDVTPSTGKYDKKRDMEEEAKTLVANQIPEELKEKYLDLFGEYNENQTKEAVVAREADKIETLLQGEVFELETGKKDVLDELLVVYEKVFKTSTGKRIYEEIKNRHEERKSG
jgi:putative hydrolase of HD superfamily